MSTKQTHTLSKSTSKEHLKSTGLNRDTKNKHVIIHQELIGWGKEEVSEKLSVTRF